MLMRFVRRKLSEELRVSKEFEVAIVAIEHALLNSRIRAGPLAFRIGQYARHSMVAEARRPSHQHNVSASK